MKRFCVSLRRTAGQLHRRCCGGVCSAATLSSPSLPNQHTARCAAVLQQGCRETDCRVVTSYCDLRIVPPMEACDVANCSMQVLSVIASRLHCNCRVLPACLNSLLDMFIPPKTSQHSPPLGMFVISRSVTLLNTASACGHGAFWTV